MQSSHSYIYPPGAGLELLNNTAILSVPAPLCTFSRLLETGRTPQSKAEGAHPCPAVLIARVVQKLQSGCIGMDGKKNGWMEDEAPTS